MSRGFIATLAGIAMTLFAWYGPWAWPAWPALTLIDLVFGSNTAFAELPYATRAATITMLIIVNVAFWAAVVWIAMRVSAAKPRDGCSRLAREGAPSNPAPGFARGTERSERIAAAKPAAIRTCDRAAAFAAAWMHDLAFPGQSPGLNWTARLRAPRAPLSPTTG